MDKACACTVVEHQRADVGRAQNFMRIILPEPSILILPPPPRTGEDKQRHRF